MNDSKYLDGNASLKQKIIVTSMAPAMGLTCAPVSLAQDATLEDIIARCSHDDYGTFGR